jgi:anti-sigma regulatory factor (Ser/Thr protein kinase)
MTAITEAAAAPLITFTLPSTPYSVQLARFYVRAAMKHHGLEKFTDDAEIIISELVTNSIVHAGGSSVSAEVMYLRGYGAVSIIVSDCSPNPPVLRPVSSEAEHWRGLPLVRALSDRWGWAPQEAGKAVYAILSR